MLGVKPSYATGFAQWPGMSEYPGLWNGLVGAWDMSLGATGNKVFDLSGNGLVGSWSDSGIIWKAGNLDFDNNEDKNGVDFGTSVLLQPDNHDFTVVVKYKAYLTSFPRNIIGKATEGSLVHWWNIHIDFDNDIVAEFDDDNDKKTLVATGTYDDSLFHQIVVTRRKGTGYKLFVDTILKATDTDNGSVSPTSSSLLLGGQTRTIDEDAAYGEYEYAYIYNRALTASEIALLHQLRKRLA